MSIRELTKEEIKHVSGGAVDGQLAMGYAGNWASTVAGAGVGMVVAGPVGGLAGAAVGFGMGSAINTIYASMQRP